MPRLYFIALSAFCALTMINAQVIYKITPDKIILNDKKDSNDIVTEHFINNTEDVVIIYVKRYVKNFEDNLDDKRTRGFTQIVLDSAGRSLKYFTYPKYGIPKEETFSIDKQDSVKNYAEDDIGNLDGDIMVPPGLTEEMLLAEDFDSMNHEGLDLPENPNFISVDKSGPSSSVIHDPSNKKARIHIEKLIIPPHDSSQYQYSLDLKFYDLQKGKYKIISCYYMDDSIKEEIGAELYAKEKDKIFTGELKANELEVIIE